MAEAHVGATISLEGINMAHSNKTRQLLIAAASAALWMATETSAAEPTFCNDLPSLDSSSLSLGRPSRGQLRGAEALRSTGSLRLLPLRHVRRCLNWGTRRLVRALVRAGEAVHDKFPNSPPLGVGDLSKASGGPIFPYSHSHQSGRDADLAFYATNDAGNPVLVDDLMTFDGAGRIASRGLRFDAQRTWHLVRALLEDRSIDVQWVFISRPLKAALIAEAEHNGASRELLRRAERVLHQPSDAPPHAGHLHLRIACDQEEKQLGCQT